MISSPLWIPPSTYYNFVLSFEIFFIHITWIRIRRNVSLIYEKNITRKRVTGQDQRTQDEEKWYGTNDTGMTAPWRMFVNYALCLRGRKSYPWNGISSFLVGVLCRIVMAFQMNTGSTTVKWHYEDLRTIPYTLYNVSRIKVIKLHCWLF